MSTMYIKITTKGISAAQNLTLSPTWFFTIYKCTRWVHSSLQLKEFDLHRRRQTIFQGRQNGRQRGKLVILALFLEQKACDVIIFKFQGGGIGPHFPLPAAMSIYLL